MPYDSNSSKEGKEEDANDIYKDLPDLSDINRCSGTCTPVERYDNSEERELLQDQGACYNSCEEEGQKEKSFDFLLPQNSNPPMQLLIDSSPQVNLAFSESSTPLSNQENLCSVKESEVIAYSPMQRDVGSTNIPLEDSRTSPFTVNSTLLYDNTSCTSAVSSRILFSDIRSPSESSSPVNYQFPSDFLSSSTPSDLRNNGVDTDENTRRRPTKRRRNIEITNLSDMLDDDLELSSLTELTIPTTSSTKKSKKNRTWKYCPTDFRYGENIKSYSITEEDKDNYETLRNYLIQCSQCKRNKSILEFYRVNGKFVCKECAQRECIPLDDLKDDFYEHLEKFKGLEDFNFKKFPVLYQCDRLIHAKPGFLFIGWSNRSDYKLVKSCVHCRNFKAQEYALKRDLTRE